MTIAVSAAAGSVTGDQGITLRTFVFLPTPQTELDAGFDRIIFERSDDSGVSYTEVAPEDGGVLTITTAQCNYLFTLSDGTPLETIVRAFKRDSTGITADSAPVVQELVDVSYEALLTIDELKRIYLFGVDLSDDAGTPFPDELFTHYIRTAISQVEVELDMPLLPTKFSENYDFRINEYERYMFLQLANYPIISVEKLRLEYPSGTEIIDFPNDWIRIKNAAGQIEVLPARGTFTQLLVSAGGGFLPLVFGGSDYIPDIIKIDYTAGLFGGGAGFGKQGMTSPQFMINAIKEVIGKKASFGPFNTAGDLIVGAGIANRSISIDGLSETIGTTSSATNAGFGARIGQYEREIKSAMPTLLRYFKGVRLSVA